MWLNKIEQMLQNPLLDASRLSYIKSVYSQLQRGHQPTEAQIYLLERFWKSHHKRLREQILG
jgi:hypothetical protein